MHCSWSESAEKCETLREEFGDSTWSSTSIEAGIELWTLKMRVGPPVITKLTATLSELRSSSVEREEPSGRTTIFADRRNISGLFHHKVAAVNQIFRCKSFDRTAEPIGIY